MNRSKVKTYAPAARRGFIQAVTDRAAHYGLSAAKKELKIEPMVEQGDVVLICGQPFPASIARSRRRLEARVKKNGFAQTMEAVAYTWFNRLVAIRFLEVHGYLDHGYRVLSHPDGHNLPEIVEQAQHVDLSGLDKRRVVELKLDGTKEEELYRLLLLAQCHALHRAMPFLFDSLDDETELLLPDNLLHSDSLIRKLVGEIEEEDWQQVEIIGWLYQFYISEKKNEVIGRVVGSEDIPAATQLFTPNWIVKYLVQNTLGRQWLATYPQSTLRHQMEYYVEPAEQTSEVHEQLTAITPTILNPEELTLLDPACGSGHILVEAYDLLKAIYTERGYRAKDIPALILNKNLFGLEIDDRSAQLAAFALMMKARADDRRILDSDAKPNVVAFQESKGLDAGEIYFTLTSPTKGETTYGTEPQAPEGLLFEPEDNLFTRAATVKVASSRASISVGFSQADIGSLLELFANAKTFGSLIQIPPKLSAKLPAIAKRLDDVLNFGDLTHASAHVFKPLLQQACLLARQYDAVAANPPYMGSKYYAPVLKAFINREYKEAKADLYACFMERNRLATGPNGFHGMINIQNWMFLTSFEGMRKSLFEQQTIDTFIHNGRGIFGSDFGSCVFVIRNAHLPEYRGSYRRLFQKQGSVASNDELEARFHKANTYTPSNADFAKIPGAPVAYWVSETIRSLYGQSTPLSQLAAPRQGMATSDNERFLRAWHEVGIHRVGLACDSATKAAASGKKWFPYNKGGAFRRWYGNNLWLLNWLDNGAELRAFDRSVLRNESYYFREGITWTTTSMGYFGVRKTEPGFLFDVKGSSCFIDNARLPVLLGFFASHIAKFLLDATNPTSENQVGDIAELPLMPNVFDGINGESITSTVTSALELAHTDWDFSETSWDFQTLPVLLHKLALLRESQDAADAECLARFSRMKELETENNRLFIAAYALQDELSPEVPDDQITLYRPDREEDIKRLLSFAVGCIMGRYSLDTPGLIYAQSGNQGFDPSQYKAFRADDDGIIPLLETDWGIPDDATNRFVEFIGVAWPKDHLEENLMFIGDSLGPTSGEQSRETIRRYFATGFFKHHLSMYKKRPIYWLFSSGKQRAFQCLVYLHRYNQGTLARMRTEYAIPLLGKITARIEQLKDDLNRATATAQRKKAQKDLDKFTKQLSELQTFDEKLRHYADQRITLDLDDGVKVNYAKFGDLLAESKSITGGKDEQ